MNRFDYHGEILTLAKETEEDFIFTRISQYMERDYNRATFAISKKMLFRALECFEQDHPEEWEQLKAECKGRLRNDGV